MYLLTYKWLILGTVPENTHTIFIFHPYYQKHERSRSIFENYMGSPNSRVPFIDDNYTCVSTRFFRSESDKTCFFIPFFCFKSQKWLEMGNVTKPAAIKKWQNMSLIYFSILYVSECKGFFFWDSKPVIHKACYWAFFCLMN